MVPLVVAPQGRGGDQVSATPRQRPVPSSGQPKPGAGPRPHDYAPATEPVAMFIKSGRTVQQVTQVLQVSFATGRVLVVCHPDVTPRWVSLVKPRTVRP